MLTLNHLHISDNLYLFRETPHFIKSIDKTLDPNKDYIMDIPLLADKIVEECYGDKNDRRIITDYILLCFFLGNDFMPHFPALNIRTDGMARLLETYKDTIRNKNLYLTDGKGIVWKNLKKLLSALAENEHDYIKIEYGKRRKQRPRLINKDSKDYLLNKMMDIPIMHREREEYINPFESGWRHRYYRELLEIDIDDQRNKEICKNYMEGLEWNMAYYTTGCKDWRWRYKYEYPPLLSDLVKFIPYFNDDILEDKVKCPVNELVQLAYVIPEPYLHLLGNNSKHKLLNEHNEWYSTHCEIKWAFCRYFWEAHAMLPHIDLNKLENILV